MIADEEMGVTELLCGLRIIPHDRRLGPDVGHR
jgi:hypothetical protein